MGLAPLIFEVPGLHGPNQAPVPLLGFALFLGTALSITALPILGRMMMEWKVTRTKLAAITIAAAATDDASGWIILASVATAVRSGFHLRPLVVMVGLTIAFGMALMFLVRPLLIRWLKAALRHNDGQMSITTLAVVLAIVLACSLITSHIGSSRSSVRLCSVRSCRPRKTCAVP